jgi:hypothetical protein
VLKSVYFLEKGRYKKATIILNNRSFLRKDIVSTIRDLLVLVCDYLHRNRIFLLVGREVVYF